MIRIFQSHRPFSEKEHAEVKKKLDEFIANWSSHGNALAAVGKLLHNRFIVIMVDESKFGASGCSIDKAMRFILDLGEEFEIDFFNRYLFSYQHDGQVFTVNQETFSKLYSEGKINGQTLVFDTLLTTELGFEENFVRPLESSWLKTMLL